jgi:ribosomal protein S18 acetylase RimI-like enzyme
MRLTSATPIPAALRISAREEDEIAPFRGEIGLRPATDADSNFLYTVYGETRREELAVTGWDDGQKEAFLRMQFDLQDSHYRQHYHGASYELILACGAPAGRLYLHRTAVEIRIMDIALLPQFRGRGIGGRIMESLVREADREGQSITLHVERNNKVLGFYERIGFRIAGEHGVYYFMERPAEQGHGEVSAGSIPPEENHQSGGGA